MQCWFICCYGFDGRKPRWQVSSSGPRPQLWVPRRTHDQEGFKPILKKLHSYCKVQNRTLETLTHALDYFVFHTP